MEKIDSVSSFWDFKGEYAYSDSKFLTSTPYPIAIILISYLWFVLKLGPEYMKTRPPFNLRNWLLAYNIMQVIISLYIFLAGGRVIWQYGLWQSTCYCEKDGLREQLIDASHLYFMVKILELVDTVFFVLRKKQNQVSFLHVYHHTLMVMATWSITKYSRTDAVIFLGVINSLVHVIMYTYYGLSAFPNLSKYLWWKKYITMMQLIQFLLMFVHVVVSHLVSECRTAYFLVPAVCSNTILFVYLFGDFYIKSYNNSKSKNIVKAGIKIGSNIGSKNGIHYIINQHKLAGKIN